MSYIQSKFEPQDNIGYQEFLDLVSEGPSQVLARYKTLTTVGMHEFQVILVFNVSIIILLKYHLFYSYCCETNQFLNVSYSKEIKKERQIVFDDW